MLLLFWRPRPGLRALLLLRCRPRFRRGRSALGLRTLARRRSLRPLSRLIPVGLRLVIRLGCRRTAGLRSIRPIVRLGCGRTIRFRPIWFRTVGLRPIVRLRCRRTIRFRPVIRRRPVGASGAVFWMRGRRIGRWPSYGTIACRVIRRPCLFGRYDCTVLKGSRLRSSCDWRLAVVRGSP